jgi:hypothetical protein
MWPEWSWPSLEQPTIAKAAAPESSAQAAMDLIVFILFFFFAFGSARIAAANCWHVPGMLATGRAL